MAKPSSSDKEVQDNMVFACSHVKCEIIMDGYPCSIPRTLINQASVVMNLYYQQNGRNPWNCDFKNSGLIVLTDPSRPAPPILDHLILSALRYIYIYIYMPQFLNLDFFSACFVWFVFAGYGDCQYQYA